MKFQSTLTKFERNQLNYMFTILKMVGPTKSYPTIHHIPKVNTFEGMWGGGVVNPSKKIPVVVMGSSNQTSDHSVWEQLWCNINQTKLIKSMGLI